MADERIDVEIADKIDGNIDKKLASIDTTAKKAHGSVQLLKKELASIRAGALNQLASALNQNASATLKAEAASARAATAQQKLATEQARTAKMAAQAEAAQLRLAAAQDRQAASAAKASAQPRRGTLQGNIDSSLGIGRSAAANGATTARLLAQAEREAAAEAGNLASRVSALKASVDPLGSAIDRTNAELAEASSLFERGAIDATTYANAQGILQTKLAAQTAAQDQYNARLRKSGQAMGLTGAEAMNFSRQLADIGVSAAMGMNPLMILIQQGPQIADVFSQAAARGVTFRAALAGIQAQLAPFLAFLLPVVAVIATVTAGFALLHRELSKSYPKNITDGMKLTEEQLERVKSKTVTFGDTVAATFTVVGRHIMNGPVGDALRWLGDRFSEVMDWIVTKTVSFVAKFIAFWVAAYKTIVKHWNNFPTALGVVVVKAVNLAIGAIEDLINAGVHGINAMIEYANQIPGIKLPTIDPVSIDRVKLAAGSVAAEIGATFDAEFASTEASIRAGMSSLAKEIQDEAVARARRRALEEAGKANKTRTPKPKKEREDTTAAKRAKALADVNRELDRELSLMGLVGPAREIESRYSQIINGLTEKGITLTKAEAEAIRNKVSEVVRLNGVQQQLERIYSELIQPAQTYNDSVEAANKLLAEGKITQAQYNREVANSARTLAEANDPYLKLNEAREQENALLGKYGRELAIATEVQARYNELKAIDASITTAALPGIEAEVRALTRKRELQEMMNAEEGNIMAAAQETTQNEFLIANYETLYNRINELRSQDVLSEEGAMRAKADLNERYARARLSNEMAMLGQLAQLQNSGNKKLAAIGKAAAMTQATIDGVLAVQKALASYPPPMNFVMAALVGATAAANVAKIAGFESGGYTGNVGRKEMAGVVHGREFVMNADATQRNRPLLEALNRGDTVAGYARGGYVQQPSSSEPGAAAPAGSAGAGNVGNGGQAGIADRFKIVNVLDPREALTALDTYEGETLIMNIIERKSNEVNGILGAR